MKIYFEPHPAQWKIFKALEPPLRGRIVMVIAGRRFGKTTLAVNVIIKRAIEIPGSRIWYVAPTKDQAYGIAWRMMLYEHRDKLTGKRRPPYLPEAFISRKREDKHYIELTNGSLIEFKGVQDEIFLLGAGLEFVVLDEFPTIPFSVWYDVIQPMLADVNGDALFIGTIPDPKVHNITKEFIDMYEEFLFRPTETCVSFNFSSFDNPYISHRGLKEIIAKLEKKGRRSDIERLYYGKYTREYGLVFPTFSRSKHVVKPIELPADWIRVMAIDPHPQKPYYALWAAIDRRNRFWFYREMEFYNAEEDRPMTLPEVAKKILEIEDQAGEKIRRRLIDPTYAKVEVKTLGQRSVKEQLREHGLYFTEASRDNMTFFNTFSSLLAEEPEPGVFIFESCPGFIDQLEHLTWDTWTSPRQREERGPKDRWKKVNDDFVDCAKYIINAGVKNVDLTSLKSFRQELEARWLEGRFL